MAMRIPKVVLAALALGLLFLLYTYTSSKRSDKISKSDNAASEADEEDAAALLVERKVILRLDGKEIDPSLLEHDPELAIFDTDAEESSRRSRETFHVSCPAGQIIFAFFPNAAPKTVAQFKAAISSGYLDGCSFYRQEPNFVLQGGCHYHMAGKKSLPNIPLEYNIPNYRGMVSTARTADPNSATSEFAIQLSDNNAKWLCPGVGCSDKHGYAVFMEVVHGWDAIDKALAAKPKEVIITKAFLQKP